jgi:hypothetical protein
LKPTKVRFVIVHKPKSSQYHKILIRRLVLMHTTSEIKRTIRVLQPRQDHIQPHHRRRPQALCHNSQPPHFFCPKSLFNTRNNNLGFILATSSHYSTMRDTHTSTLCQCNLPHNASSPSYFITCSVPRSYMRYARVLSLLLRGTGHTHSYLITRFFLFSNFRYFFLKRI